MRSGLGLLVVMLLAAGVGIIAAHSQSQSVAAPETQAISPSVPIPPAGTVYMLGAGANGNGPRFVPATLTVSVGKSITWLNRDSIGHTATADGGQFNSDVLNPGQRFSWTARSPGTYRYSDYNQSDMQGAIIVRP